MLRSHPAGRRRFALFVVVFLACIVLTLRVAFYDESGAKMNLIDVSNDINRTSTGASSSSADRRRSDGRSSQASFRASQIITEQLCCSFLCCRVHKLSVPEGQARDDSSSSSKSSGSSSSSSGSSSSSSSSSSSASS